MEIQYYNIDFVKKLRETITDGIPDDIKQSLLHIKQKNGFTVYSSTTSVPSFGNKIKPTTYQNSESDIAKKDDFVVEKEKEIESGKTNTNAWRNETSLVTRKPINPNDNAKKKELFLLLNKISESNFQVISKQLISLVKECEAENNSVFSILISRLFQSAMIQVSFCPIYAKICVNLISELDSEKVHQELDQRITTQVNSLKDYSSSVELQDYESFCDDIAFKNKYIGCYQFITELLNNKCLPFLKLKEVLHDLDDNINKQESSIKIDILIESICKIYQSIDRRMLQEYQIKEVSDIVSEILKKYREKMSSRSRYIFEDVLEKKY